MPRNIIRQVMPHSGPVVAALLATSAAAQPAIHDLGTLTPGTGLSYGLSISDSGDAATGYSNSPFGERAFLWTPATGILSLDAPTNYTRTRGYGISGDGTTVVGFGTVSFTDRALRWTASTGWTTVTSTGGFANATNADGTVTTGQAISQNGQLAFRSAPQPYGLQFIPALPGGGFAIGFATSGDGRVIVGRSNSTLGDRAFRYFVPDSGPAILTDLGVLLGGTYSYANGVSNDGGVVVGESFSTVGRRAFRWTAQGGMQSLGNLGASGTSVAYAANGNGQVVIGSASVSGGTRGFVWTPDAGMVDAATYFSARGVNMSGWTIEELRDVNPAATAFIGTGVIGGQTRAVVVRGLPSPCLAVITDQPDNTYWTPELTTATLLARATGPDLAYRWQYEFAPGVFVSLTEGVNNIPGSFVSFNAVNTLRDSLLISSIENAEPGRVLSFRCIVSNGCGEVTSVVATVTLAPPPPACPADVDDGSGSGTPDGGVGIEDLLYYISIYELGITAADVDDGSATGTPDGGVGIEDLLYYLARYDAGC